METSERHPLRDSSAYEIGRRDAANFAPLLSTAEFNQCYRTYALTHSTYHYYWRGYSRYGTDRGKV